MAEIDVEPSLETDRIIQGDCVEVLKSLPKKSVDLIFADPPYNLQLAQALHRPNLSAVDAVDDEWDKFSSFSEYDRFTRGWLSACREVLKDSGTLWVIGSYHNIFRVGAALQDLDYWILNDVVWIKSNPMPNFRGVRFCNAHETLIWAARSKAAHGLTFNYHAMKAENDGLQMRSDWYFPICGGPERLRDRDGDGSKVHATQKPLALLERIIRACSKPGDIVLDPFFGSGTTGAAAKRLGRRYLGIERESAYIDAASARLELVDPIPYDELDHPIPKPSRVPFAALLELGLVAVGERLRLGNRDVFAIVMADGTLASGDARGTIHRLGARLLGAPACNGWEHWLYRNGAGEFLPIDHLRRRARELKELPIGAPEGHEERAVSSTTKADPKPWLEFE